MDSDTRLKRLRFRAWHRGTREADMLVGGYFDAGHAHWDDAELAWFEALIEEQDADIIAWTLGVAPAPAQLHGPMLDRLLALGYLGRAR